MHVHVKHKVQLILFYYYSINPVFFSANVPYFQAGTVQSDSYIKFQPLVLREDEFAASFQIRPEAAAGLIMYSGSGEDFISLAMRGGKLEFR